VKSVWKWAVHAVQSLTGHGDKPQSKPCVPKIATDKEFRKKIKGLESWSQSKRETKVFDCTIFDGLPSCVWRTTRDSATDSLIESRCVTGLSREELSAPLPADCKGISTTVWFVPESNQSGTPLTTQKSRGLMRSMQFCTAVFLLEACCYLASGAQWGSNWTQRIYGTGTADVWETFSSRNQVTELAWNQGWLTLQPLGSADPKNPGVRDYVLTTLEERAPRLVLISTPTPVWNATRPSATGALNATRQKEKKLRERTTPFLELASEIAEYQLSHDRDFLLETPLCNVITKNKAASKLLKDERTEVAIGHMCKFG